MIKRVLIFLCFLGMVSATFSVKAEAISSKDGIEVGAEIYHFNYEEPNFMEDTGMFYGLNAKTTSYFRTILGFGNPTERGEERFSMQLDGRFAFGIIDYTSVSTGELNNILDFVFETRGVFGYDFPVTQETIIRPYIGLGYRYLNDDTAGEITTTGAVGYKRESNYFYLPMGLDFITPINESWTFGANAEFDFFLYGRQKSHLDGAIAGLNSLENDQKNGLGARGSVELRHSSDTYDFYVEPFVRYWHVDDSDTSAITYGGVLVGYGLEPENKTFEVGLKIGLAF